MVAKNGNNLQEAMALLINNQAAFVGQLGETNRRQRTIEKKLDTIERILLRHERILLRHDRVLDEMPEAIRRKVGFKPER